MGIETKEYWHVQMNCEVESIIPALKYPPHPKKTNLFIYLFSMNNETNLLILPV
jgi:hypothetical protein